MKITKNNYRTAFKKYYGIDIPNGYEIHHIDLDRNNNDINNLLLLPVKLHHEYHFYLSATRAETDNGLLRYFNAKICGGQVNTNDYEIMMIEGLIRVLDKCKPWYDYKLYLDGYLPNIHNIELQ